MSRARRALACPRSAGRSWRVWQELGRRPQIELVWAYLTGQTGRIEQLADGRRRIIIDARLDQVERRAVLAHELVHDERGVLFTSATPDAVVAKEEAWVDVETARRLVPPLLLAALVRVAVAEGDAVSWPEVAEWFEVPADVAVLALRRLVDHPP